MFQYSIVHLIASICIPVLILLAGFTLGFKLNDRNIFEPEKDNFYDKFKWWYTCVMNGRRNEYSVYYIGIALIITIMFF